MIHTDIKCLECKDIVLASVAFVGHVVDEMYAQTDGEQRCFFLICETCMQAQAERAWEANTESGNR